METTSAPHDNVNVKVSNSFNGQFVIVGSLYVGVFSSFILLLFMFTHWAQAIALSAFIVYGVVSVVILVLVGAAVAFWIRFVINPGIDVKERLTALKGQNLRNRVAWTQENAIVAEIVDGTLTVFPLFPSPAKMIEAPKPFERPVDKPTVIELYDNLGMSVKAIAKDLDTSEYKVNQIVTQAGVMRKKGD
jgi:hypothetical protein